LQTHAITLADLEEAAEEVSIGIEEVKQARINIRMDKTNDSSQLPRIQEVQSDLFERGRKCYEIRWC